MKRTLRLALIGMAAISVAGCHQKNTLQTDGAQCNYEVELHGARLEDRKSLLLDCMFARGWTKEQIDDANKAAQAAAKAAETPEDRAYDAASDVVMDKLLAAAEASKGGRDPAAMAKTDQLLREVDAAQKVADAAKLAAEKSHEKK